MTAEAPAVPFTEEPLVDGVRLVLPRRPLRALPGPRVAIGLSLVGALVVAGAVVAMLARELGPLVLLPAGVVAAALALPAVWMLRSRSVVEVDRTEVRAVEHVGLLRLRRRRPRDAVSRIAVQELPVRGGREAAGIGWVAIECGAQAPLRAAPVYPVGLLLPVAARLAELLGLPGDAPAVETFAPGAVPPGALSDQPPPGSRAVLERNPAGLLLTVPPQGFRGAARTLLLLGAAFALLPLVLGGAAFMAEGGEGAVFAILGVFLAIGLALVTGGVVAARRHALVAIAQGDLLIRRESPLGVRRHEFPRGEVTAVLVVDSNTHVNDRPLKQLRIETRGRPLRLWTGRDERELRWIAAVLQDGLQLDGARLRARS